MNTRDKSYCYTGIVDGKDFMYFTTLGPLNPVRYYPDEDKFVSANDSGKNYPNGSLSLYVSNKGDTIFGVYSEGIWIKSKDGIVDDRNVGQVFNMDEDRAGNVWIASWSYVNRNLKEGVFKYDGTSTENLQSEFGITDKEIWSVMCDKEQDIIWIGTLNDGLYKASNSEIITLQPKYFGLQEFGINSLTIDSKDRLWIADKSELISMEPDGSYCFVGKHKIVSTFQQYWQTTNRFVYAQIDSVQKALRTLQVSQISKFIRNTKFNYRRIIENNDSSIFFSNRFGLYSYNPENKSIDYFGVEAAEDFFEFIGKDTLISAGWGNAFLNPCFRSKSANITNSTKQRSPLFSSNILFPFNPEGEPKDVSQMIKYKNQLWYTSWVSGLWMSNGLSLTHFNKTDSTINNNLNDICFDKKDHVIFGSNNGEIYIATYFNKKLTIDFRINEQNGLLGNTINWLVADNQGFLWTGTNLGLNCIDLNKLYNSQEYYIRHFDKEEGYNGQTSKDAVIDSKDNIYIATNSAIIKFNTNSLINKKTAPCKTILRSLFVNQQQLDNTLIRENSRLPIRFSYTQNNFLFHFDVLNYINSNKDLFRYKLEGFDKEWSEWENARQANYTNLPSGKYRFCVQSNNQNTLLEAKPLYIEFFIEYPFWMLWYFQLLVILIVGTIIVIITKKLVDKKRMKQIRESEIEKKLLELEMKALQAQMNPHFIFNCISGIQYCILDNKLDEVIQYLSDFSKVVRISLENASLSFIQLDKEIDFLYSYLRLEQMRFQDKFEFEIQHQAVKNKATVFIPPMMVQPFAENAIKHGFCNLNRKGKLSIVFETNSEDVVKCTITDNGKGRLNVKINQPNPSKNDRIHSTNITDMRMQLFNQPENFKIKYTDLFDNDTPSGLKVELNLPNGKN